jgi:hypothetical protein
VNWAGVYHPLHRGGIGIPDLQCFGRALWLRWLWLKWETSDKPWCDMELPIDEVDEALFAAATKVTVHNGTKAQFWTSSWLQGCAPAVMFHDLFKHRRRKNRSMANAMNNDNWIKDVMHDISAPLFVDYVKLWHLVAASPFDRTDQEEDDIVWARFANGVYSAKLAYNIQFDGGFESVFPNTIWQIWAPTRCKFFIWLLLQNWVWTADRLLLREWPNQYFCPLCFRNLETADHLMQEYPLARQVWTDISLWSHSPSLNPLNWKSELSLASWFNGLSRNAANAKGLKSLIILVCWTIWHERNSRIFEGKEKPMSQLVAEMQDEARTWFRAGALRLSSFVESNISE